MASSSASNTCPSPLLPPCQCGVNEDAAQPWNACCPIPPPMVKSWQRQVARWVYGIAHCIRCFFYLQTVWVSPAMRVPKSNFVPSFIDHQAVNEKIEKSLGIMPCHGTHMVDSSGAIFLGKVDFLHGYWQIPLAPETRGLFTIVTPDGLYDSSRVPKGASNSTSYFQGILTQPLHYLKCSI